MDPLKKSSKWIHFYTVIAGSTKRITAVDPVCACLWWILLATNTAGSTIHIRKLGSTMQVPSMDPPYWSVKWNPPNWLLDWFQDNSRSCESTALITPVDPPSDSSYRSQVEEMHTHWLFVVLQKASGCAILPSGSSKGFVIVDPL